MRRAYREDIDWLRAIAVAAAIAVGMAARGSRLALPAALADAVCEGRQCPPIPLAWDHAHLTAEGSVCVMGKVVPVLGLKKWNSSFRDAPLGAGPESITQTWLWIPGCAKGAPE